MLLLLKVSSLQLILGQSNRFLKLVKAGIESFAVDSQQKRLYTLHTGGEIEFYDVSANRFDLRSKYNRLKHDLNRDPKSGAVTVVSISAIGGHESKRACLVAIASNGRCVKV